MLAKKDHVHTTTLLHFPDIPAKISELVGEVAEQSRHRGSPPWSASPSPLGFLQSMQLACNSCCFYQIQTELRGNKGEMLAVPLPHLL